MMHRLRTRKKAKEASFAPRRPSDESEVPSISSLGGKPFKWSKGQQTEAKPEFDLAHALPPTDDFRTSLLMPKMSARFSMLREQDDPSTKIGKANDDSVLSLKRSSRYGEFGVSSGPWTPGGTGTGLADIMEVSSIRGSIRPPFANSNGSSEDICTDDDSSHGGGVMARSRGGEGNNLFGGRQKVYKIPTGASSSKNLSSAGGDQDHHRGMGGKFVYENDVAMSSFQRLRETEREREREMDRKDEEAEFQRRSEHQHTDRSNSPPLSDYNKNRETSSSTTSGPFNTRVSTAATSITSQNPPSIYGGNSQALGNPPALPSTSSGPQGTPAVERSATKSRRPLYEQGLDQHLHEQQSHAINKLDILSRQRTANGGTPQSQSPSLNHTGSASNLNERHDRPMSPTTNADTIRMRIPSPPPTSAYTTGASSSGTIETSLDKYNTEESSPHKASGQGRNGPQSKPLNMGSNGVSNPWSASSGQTSDGGATATMFGAFARQRKQYDEQQYSQRQIQMQVGREARLPPRAPPPQTPAPSPPPAARARGDASAAYRSRSSSSTQRQYPPSAEPSPRKMTQTPDMSRPRANISDTAQSNGTFTFLDVSSPETEDVSSFPHHSTKSGRKPDGRYNQHFPPQVQREPLSEHPANLRIPDSRNEPVREVTREDSVIPTSDPRGHKGAVPDNIKSSDEEGNDSPTLGPDGGLNLLVRRHLRSDSGVSSVYGGVVSSYYGTSTSGTNGTRNSRSGPAPGVNKDMSTRESRTTEQSLGSSSGNPFEFEDWDGGYFAEAESNSSISPTGPGVANGSVPPPVSVGSKLHQEQRVAGKSDEPARGGLAGESGMGGRHMSKASTDTQRERDDFASELAQRRKKIQENLRNYNEKERSMSPVSGSPAGTPAMEYTEKLPFRAGSPFGVLNPKSNRVPEGPLKAKKLLGLGVNGINGSPRAEDDYWRREEERMLHEVVKAPKIPPNQLTPQIKATPEFVQPPNPSKAGRQGPPGREETRHDEFVFDLKNRSTPRPSRPSSSSPSSVRERSGSENSLGAKNRDIKYRDDLQRAMAIGVGSSASQMEDPHAGRKFSDPSRPTLETSQHAYTPGSGSATSVSGRSRSNSKSTFPGAFDSNDMLAFQTTGMPPRPSPSPITPFSANSTPPLYETPITSAVPTPTKGTGPGFQSTARVPSSRKKSINKADISEPIFVSATSTITTVNLPPGASLKNGSDAPPPVPPLNPRRRRLTTTQTVFGAFSRNEKSDNPPMPIAQPSPSEERSTFSADEESSRPKLRTKLRKSSSEGGNMNARARQQAMMAPSPAMPVFPGTPMAPSPVVPTYPNNANTIPPQRIAEGGMF
ncbi:hypothetical protein FGG08_002774 [Glutinoglossum americanum]|uniref:Uncharacterized protein n=1 Tax=Glutinoglossum americanum TaxID=1670608 RepID=A0A9P8I8I1_9PEZI|nr:hypothetical protein FGG08_002774 [Glutinoglossum americanum]